MEKAYFFLPSGEERFWELISPYGILQKNQRKYIRVLLHGHIPLDLIENDYLWLNREGAVPALKEVSLLVVSPGEVVQSFEKLAVANGVQGALAKSNPALKYLAERYARRYFPEKHWEMLYHTPVYWNNRFSGTTAGMSRWWRLGGDQSRSIELSTKYMAVYPEQLKPVLLHEMIHTILPPGEKHGPVFKQEMARINASLQREGDGNLLSVRIPQEKQMPKEYRFQYRCVNCGQEYNRVRKPLDTRRCVCGRCRGRLRAVTNT